MNGSRRARASAAVPLPGERPGWRQDATGVADLHVRFDERSYFSVFLLAQNTLIAQIFVAGQRVFPIATTGIRLILLGPSDPRLEGAEGNDEGEKAANHNGRQASDVTERGFWGEHEGKESEGKARGQPTTAVPPRADYGSLPIVGSSTKTASSPRFSRLPGLCPPSPAGGNLGGLFPSFRKIGTFR